MLSYKNAKNIVPAAIALMKNGYHMYITRAKVRGEELMRLRAGFFKDRSEANAVGKKIMSILKADEPWIIKIGDRELKEFGGY